MLLIRELDPHIAQRLSRQEPPLDEAQVRYEYRQLLAEASVVDRTIAEQRQAVLVQAHIEQPEPDTAEKRETVRHLTCNVEDSKQRFGHALVAWFRMRVFVPSKVLSV